MQKVQIFYDVMTVGLAVLGLTFLVIAVCAGFDPERGLAGCALICSARYMS
jgi:hypothetical protein